MDIVNRSVAVIKPKKPFLDWLNTAPDNEVELTLDNIRADCNVLLLPDFDEPEEAVTYIDDLYEQLFEMELAAWYEDTQLWPKQRSLKLFWEWFDVELHSTVIDTVAD